MLGKGVIQESADPLPFVHPPPDTLLFRPNPEATPARLSKVPSAFRGTLPWPHC